MQEILIDSEYIKLGQLLKLAGLVDSGSVAKIMISEGLVAVNGEVDLRRGRKVYPEDVVTFEEEAIIVAKG